MVRDREEENHPNHPIGPPSPPADNGMVGHGEAKRRGGKATEMSEVKQR
jgi:hypothetical protein